MALMSRRTIVLVVVLAIGVVALRAQQRVFTDVFPPAEFAARRAAVMEKIGDAVAILQGSGERPGEQAFRQNNEFFYLSGVEMVRALLVVDGKAKRTTLYLPPRDERRERMYGDLLFPGDEAVKITGIDAVAARDQFAAALQAFAREGRTIYTPFRPEVLGSASSGDVTTLAATNANDPWDGRPSREAAFLQKLHTLGPRLEVRNLDPILDTMRFTKSPREIEVVREATRIGGEAIVEVMKEARPGMKEYELEAVANYVFRRHGAYGPAYFGLFATGANTVYSHYHKGTATLQDGDWVQVDYGPDYKYYVSDITRVFPASGRFTPRQREFYTIYLQLYRSLLAAMRPHVSPSEIVKDAVARMDAAIASFAFTDPKIKAAAVRFTDGYRNRRVVNSLGHSIGMEVHDVGSPTPTLEPGQIFTIEPAMSIPDEKMSMRLEDSLLVTETGIENLSAFVPIDPDAVEKTMTEAGLTKRPRRPVGR
jgi:Xaa-Pro aminopeptidase